MNSAFSGQPGAFEFNMLYDDTEERIVFGSDHAGSFCVMEYSDTLPGVKNLYFLSNDIKEAYMCASMTYYSASRFLGENQGLLDWLNGAYPAVSEHISAGGEDLYREYTVSVGEYQPAVAFLDFQVEDNGGVSFAVGLEYEHAMLVW